MSPAKRRKLHSSSPRPGNGIRISPRRNEGLSEQIGYSHGGANALSVLEQLLNDAEGPLHATESIIPGLHTSKQGEFWKAIDNLPSVPVVQALVQSFFSEANWYFAVLDQYFFDVLLVQWTPCHLSKDRAGSLSLTLSHFPPLLFQVLALALQFLPSGHPCEAGLGVEQQKHRDAMSAKFSEQGEKLLGLLGRRSPSITSVQADLMRCAWLKNDGRGAEAWYSLGSAVRQAQELGLHRQASRSVDASNITAENLKGLWHAEHKRRLWVTLFIWESHMSLQLGRPRMIHVSDCTLTDPIDCDFPLEPARTLFRTPGPGERPSSFTLQLVKYKIGHIIHRMMSIGATNPLLEDYGILQSLHDDVSELLKSLPPTMQLENPDTSWDVAYPSLVKQRLQISIVAYSFLVALHRPHASRHVSSRRNATDAAIRSLEASHELFNRSEPHHYKIYTLVFYTIDLGIFLAAAAIKYHNTATETRRRIDQTLEQAVRRLGVLKDRNTAARYGEATLRRCIQKYRQAWTNETTFNIDLTQENGALTRSTLADTGAFTTTTLEHDPLLGRDLFDDITNARVSTTSWLEHMDMMSTLDFRLDESDFMWDNLFG